MRMNKKPWYEEENDKDIAASMCAHVSSLRSNELSTFRRNALFYMRLYSGTANISSTLNNADEAGMRFNLVKSGVDTGAAILGAARTLPFFDTRGADWQLRRKAQNCNQVLQTQFQEIEVFDHARAAILDACITGLGVIKFFADPTKKGGTPSCERVPPLSLVWDPAEATYGTPSSYYQVALSNRDYLKAIYPEFSDKIDEANGPDQYDEEDFILERSGSANQCVVYEGWHLPSSAESGDGVHTICIPGACLFKEEWKVPRPPLAILHGWQPALAGLVGQSLAMHLVEPQKRIVEIINHVTTMQKLGSNAHVILHDASNIEPQIITNTPLRVYRVKSVPGSAPPQFVKFEATPFDLQDQLGRIREEAFSMLGLSQQQVQGEKPAGINSAVGMRALEDIQSKRHIINLRFVERFYLDCSQCLLDLNNHIAETSESAFKVNYKSRRNFINETKWLSVRPGDETRLAVLPVSQLVGSVSSQMQQATEWAQNGWTDPATAKMLVNHPDIEGQSNVDNVDLEYAMDVADDILNELRVSIDPYADIITVMKHLRTEYLTAKRLKAPDPILNEFRRVLEQLKRKSQEQEALMAPPPPPPDSAPQIAPPPA